MSEESTSIVATTETSALAAVVVEALEERLLMAYLAELDLRPRSRETYAKALRRFFAWTHASGRAFTQLSRADVLAYKEQALKNLSPSTVAAYLTAVRSLFSYLHAKYNAPNIAEDVKNPKTRQGHRKDALSAEQARAVLRGINREGLRGKRDYALTALLFHTGLRTCEAERANIEDLRRIAGEPVLYVQGKGRDAKDDYVKITPSVRTALAEYLAAREATEGHLKPSAPLFASLSRRDYGQRLTARSVSRICKAALVAAGFDDSRLTAHSFRHTAVTCALLAGASIRDVQQMARHASPITTERYAHDLHRLEDAAEDKLEALLCG